MDRALSSWKGTVCGHASPGVVGREVIVIVVAG
jgi:hypothetical protein